MADDVDFVNNINLIEAVKNCPVLWDNRLDEYKDVEHKKGKWVQLAEKFGVSAGTQASCCCRWCLWLVRLKLLL